MIKTQISFVMVYLGVVVLAALGWILNVIAVVNSAGNEHAEQSAWFLIRLAGIAFPPLGAVLGYL